MAYKNKKDQKEFCRKWYIKNKKRIIKKVSIRNKFYVKRNQEYLNKIKLDTGCIDCGYNKEAVALDFDHLKDKNINLSLLVKRTSKLEVLDKEIKKCEVVCANCHRIRTKNRLPA